MEIVLLKKTKRNWVFLIFILVWLVKNYIETLVKEIVKEILKEIVKQIISSLARYILVSGLCKKLRSFGNK